MKGLFQCPPWARSFWAFSPYLNHMRKFSSLQTAVHAPANFCQLLFAHYHLLSIPDIDARLGNFGKFAAIQPVYCIRR